MSAPRAVKQIEKQIAPHKSVKNPWALAWAVYQRRQQAKRVREYREKHRR